MSSKFLAFVLCLGLVFPANAADEPQFRLFAIREARKWGFIDRSGQVVVKPRYDEVGTRSEGLWSVRRGSKWGFVAEATGDLSVAPRYEAVGTFSEGLCAVVAGGKVGFIGKNGVFQIAPRFAIEQFDLRFGLWTSRYLFSTGLSPAEISEGEAEKQGFKGTWGFIDRRGTWKIAPRFRDADAMSDGMALVTLEDEAGGQEGYVSSDGKFTPLPLGGIGLFCEPFFEGLAAVTVVSKDKEPRRLLGFIDKNGKWAIEPRFIAVLPGGDPIEGRIGFHEGLATVLEGQTSETVRLGWIGKDGKWAIEPRFNGGGSGFVRGLTPARIGNKMGEGLGGLIDKTGQFVIAPQFEKMGVFTDELAPVQRKGEKWGYIDRSGTARIAPRFDYIPLEKVITPDMMSLQFRDGLAYVAQGQARGYINRKGEWVWKEGLSKGVGTP